MKNATRLVAVLAILLACAACGDDDNGDSNNVSDTGTTNNNGADVGTDTSTEDTGGGGGGVTATGDTCEAIEFTACGGDLVGTWTLSSGCVTPSTLPRYTECEPVDIAVSVSPAGDLTLADDGSFTVNNFAFDTELDATVPKACLNEGESCTDNEIDDEGVEAGDACELNYGHDVFVRDPGSYTVDDTSNILALADDGGFAVGNFEYCVDGDTLQLRRTDVTTHEAILTLTKQ
ncbi:hypothetical protein FIV42_01370 [Persicimonas caeni]|uniref:Lipocalin-like domain-containing protein n=1 Tax=Persicimonas caeni TaxID=2292766 RepID=A0A4Y6PMD1_PERCE|nr:hypothetical protein [Persicimonas caeni]QDG49432.1 hypothetical protein FIV42_01370 [Persicimonas caeni]QED30653.1 hypothetical protein FRD00_01365 [Persicimonas caeni]